MAYCKIKGAWLKTKDSNGYFIGSWPKNISYGDIFVKCVTV